MPVMQANNGDTKVTLGVGDVSETPPSFFNPRTLVYQQQAGQGKIGDPVIRGVYGPKVELTFVNRAAVELMMSELQKILNTFPKPVPGTDCNECGRKYPLSDEKDFGILYCSDCRLKNGGE